MRPRPQRAAPSPHTPSKFDPVHPILSYSANRLLSDSLTAPPKKEKYPFQVWAFSDITPFRQPFHRFALLCVFRGIGLCLQAIRIWELGWTDLRGRKRYHVVGNSNNTLTLIDTIKQVLLYIELLAVVPLIKVLKVTNASRESLSICRLFLF